MLLSFLRRLFNLLLPGQFRQVTLSPAVRRISQSNCIAQYGYWTWSPAIPSIIFSPQPPQQSHQSCSPHRPHQTFIIFPATSLNWPVPSTTFPQHDRKHEQLKCLPQEGVVNNKHRSTDKMVCVCVTHQPLLEGATWYNTNTRSQPIWQLSKQYISALKYVTSHNHLQKAKWKRKKLK